MNILADKTKEKRRALDSARGAGSLRSAILWNIKKIRAMTDLREIVELMRNDKWIALASYLDHGNPVLVFGRID